MSYAIGIACGLLAILILCGFLYLRRKRVERSESSDLDIPAFLRSDGAGDDIEGNIKIPPDIVNIHPWGKTK